MTKLILTTLVILLTATGCGDDLPAPGARYLRGYYEIIHTDEEHRCDGHRQSYGWVENPGEIKIDASDLRPGAVDMFFTFEYNYYDDVWYSNFQGITVGENDGYFEGWSHYSFIRDGRVVVSTFETIKGTVTVDGIEIDHAIYIMDSPPNNFLPTCSMTQHIYSL